MDVKSAFLYGKIEEKVYVCQPPGFEDPYFPDRVYKVEKVLYGLHQASRAWYETLSTYLLDNRFQRGKIDKTLFIRKDKGDILLVQVYVDDIIFGSTKKSLCTEFEKMMQKKFQMSYIGELTFFLGLFTDVKTASTPMETQKPLLKDENGEEVDVHLYRSMIGSLMYLTSLRPNIMFAMCACARYQVNPKVSHLHAVKRIFRYLKGKDFSGRETPLFPTMVVQAQEEIGEGSAMPTDPHHTPIITKPSSSQPRRKQKSRRSKRKDTEEDASKQGRKIDDIDADIDITLVNDVVNDQDMFDVNDLAGEEVFVAEQGVYDSKKDDVAQVNTAVTIVSTASTIPVSAATITEDEITLAQALAELKSVKPKDKGKGIMVEEPLKMKKKDQINFDEQEAIRLQDEFDKEERLAREKNEANIALTEE
ncbi:putative ribonuclease H-like domain-containing protein [Tanacetum coccineum]